MHSRAYLLLKRDLVNLQRFPLKGVAAAPASEVDVFRWAARLDGLEGTEWEGGVFHVQLKFSPEFNSSPPMVQFMSIPFHPNIHPTDGTPCCSTLSTGWSEDMSVSSLLLSLQALLPSPELDPCCILNWDAAQLLQDAPHTYQQIVRDCVTSSIRLDAGLTMYHEEEEVVSRRPSGAASLPSPRPVQRPHPHPISFDDYHSLWCSLATSHPVSLRPLPVNTAAAQADIRHRLQLHHTLQYGQGGGDGCRQRQARSRARPAPHMARARRLEQLRRMYFAEKEEEEREEVEEGNGMKELDGLLNWTRQLSDTELGT